jgi:hypothetical protein
VCFLSLRQEPPERAKLLLASLPDPGLFPSGFCGRVECADGIVRNVADCIGLGYIVAHVMTQAKQLHHVLSMDEPVPEQTDLPALGVPDAVGVCVRAPARGPHVQRADAWRGGAAARATRGALACGALGRPACTRRVTVGTMHAQRCTGWLFACVSRRAALAVAADVVVVHGSDREVEGAWLWACFRRFLRFCGAVV